MPAEKKAPAAKAPAKAPAKASAEAAFVKSERTAGLSDEDIRFMAAKRGFDADAGEKALAK